MTAQARSHSDTSRCCLPHFREWASQWSQQDQQQCERQSGDTLGVPQVYAQQLNLQFGERYRVVYESREVLPHAGTNIRIVFDV